MMLLICAMFYSCLVEVTLIQVAVLDLKKCHHINMHAACYCWDGALVLCPTSLECDRFVVNNYIT